METLKSVGTTSAASARKSTAKYAKANKSKLRAKWRIQSAKRSGKIKRPEKCPRCGRAVALDFHHTNKSYSEGSRMTGKWLCRRCHSSVDPTRHGKPMSDSMKKAKG